MAIEIEFANVVVRKSGLERSYPGGVDELARRPLANFVEDDHLVRIGYMSTGEALVLVDELRATGVSQDDVALIQGGDAPPWIVVGTIDGRRCCWLRGEPPGVVVRASDDTFVVGLPFDVNASAADVVRRCGATLEAKSEQDAFRCVRRGAEIELQILENRPSRIYVVVGQREFSRRRQFANDRMLLADVLSALISTGARILL